MRITKLLTAAVLTLLLVMSFAGMSFAEEQATAADLRLIKIEGSVTITNDAGVTLPPIANMKLSSGTHIKTDANGYAWLGLDETKFIKLDHSSDANVVKEGKLLKVNLDQGAIFFNVTSPLKSDEEMRIHTSTTITGIRGTMGVVRIEEKDGELARVVKVQILEGQTASTVVNKENGDNRSVEVDAEQWAWLTIPTEEVINEGRVIVFGGYTNNDVPAFVVDEMIADSTIADRTAAACPNLDVPLIIQQRKDEQTKVVASTSRKSSGGSSGGTHGPKKRKQKDPDPTPEPDPHNHEYTIEYSHEIAGEDASGGKLFTITYKCSCGVIGTEPVTDKTFNEVEKHTNISYKDLKGTIEDKEKGFYIGQTENDITAYGKCPDCGERIEIKYDSKQAAIDDGVPIRSE